MLTLAWFQALFLGLGMGQGWHGSGLLWPAAGMLGWAWLKCMAEMLEAPSSCAADGVGDDSACDDTI